MDAADSPYGWPSPSAPREHSRFAMPIGRWECDACLKGPDDLGGVPVSGVGITFKLRRPPGGPSARVFPPHTLFRISYSNISDTEFTWSSEVSTDGEKTLSLVQVMDAHQDPKSASP